MTKTMDKLIDSIGKATKVTQSASMAESVYEDAKSDLNRAEAVARNAWDAVLKLLIELDETHQGMPGYCGSDLSGMIRLWQSPPQHEVIGHD